MSRLLEVKDLSVSYGKVDALVNVSLAVEKGQIVTIIGPNGAGKTTMLAAIMGLLKSSGTITYQGQDVARMDVEDRVTEGLCLVPEKARAVRRPLRCRQSPVGSLSLPP